MPPESPPGLLIDTDTAQCRCAWSGHDPLYHAYHDEEWGRPVTDDRRLFEKICLEGFQSGLSWLTILRKRDAFREVFADFDFTRIARFGEADIQRLLLDARIIRHRGKIEATINNAARAIELATEFGSLGAYFWQFEPDDPSIDEPTAFEQIRARVTSPASIAMARDLKRRGWRFVGPTTAYAFMQAMGMVNDHIAGCHAQAACAQARARLIRPRAGR
ncbi:MAG: DNA-3-methyladenine glycosylase I [Burkholderiaceae bacterium]